jgi:histone acetyltransferase (RNA polymerase elongator complex component)
MKQETQIFISPAEVKICGGEDGMCCCCCRQHHWHHRGFGRRFLTREEQIKELEEYLEDLKKEMAAVETRLKELKG